MAPEYIARGRLNEKVDVYSFGVLVMEIITGVKNNKHQSEETFETIVAWVNSFTCLHNYGHGEMRACMHVNFLHAHKFIYLFSYNRLGSISNQIQSNKSLTKA